MPVTFSSYRPGQRVSYKTVPPPWDWLLRRENELGPRISKSQIIFAVLVPPLYVAVQAPALIVTHTSTSSRYRGSYRRRQCFPDEYGTVCRNPFSRRLPVTWPNTVSLNFFVESFGLKILSQVTTKLSQLHSNSRNK